MKTKTTHEKLRELIHNQALETSAYVRNLQPPREIDEAELRDTLDPNFWFKHNRLLRLLHHEMKSLSGALSSEEELRIGDATIIHLGYLANAVVTSPEIVSDGAVIFTMDDYRQSVAGNQTSMQTDYHEQSNAS